MCLCVSVEMCFADVNHRTISILFMLSCSFFLFQMFSVYSSIKLKPSMKPDYQIQILFESPYQIRFGLHLYMIPKSQIKLEPAALVW